MGKLRLTTLKPRLQTLKPAIRTAGTAAARWTGRKLTEWRQRILAQEPLCRPCNEAGRVTVATEIDHIVPLENGGGYDESNVQPICTHCHQAKTARDRGYRVKPTIGSDGWPV
jgi:5-methylcytosine-specific restriction enzyme A